MNRRPRPQELYRHFKGGKYQVITIAKDADTGDEYVIYQALYGDFQVYSRSLAEFVSEVDTVKYPNADQHMRFEPWNPSDKDEDGLAGQKIIGEKKEEVPVKELKKDDDQPNQNYMDRTIEDEAKEFGMNPLVVEFLDADNCKDRLEILNRLRPIATNDMIDIMAMAIDTEVPGDDPDLRVAELKECLLTKQRFEVTRLR
ncbi:MAG: DUF1653 domain-containing protein [Butyrivibrio sp.]|nr:DUF1653 domain-containing protein [Butyrivibrio sp.]